MVAQPVLALGNRPDARLFTGPRGGRITTAVLRDATHWDDVVPSLGYEHRRRHDLHHTGPTWMADTGVPPYVLRLIAGHGSLQTQAGDSPTWIMTTAMKRLSDPSANDSRGN